MKQSSNNSTWLTLSTVAELKLSNFKRKHHHHHRNKNNPPKPKQLQQQQLPTTRKMSNSFFMTFSTFPARKVCEKKKKKKKKMKKNGMTEAGKKNWHQHYGTLQSTLWHIAINTMAHAEIQLL